MGVEAGTTTGSYTLTIGAPNLVVNGGFEGGTFNGIPNNGGQPNGWTIGGSSPAAPGGGFYDEVVSSSLDPVHSGSDALYIGAVTSDYTIDQNIATVAGATYRIHFWLYNAGGTPSDFSASFGGSTLMSLTNTAAQGYTQYTFYRTAASSTSDLHFAALQVPTNWLLDDISVIDPATQSDDTTIVQTGAAPSTFGNSGSLHGEAGP
jgi:hypothetical protein